ncbi:MAG: hypothetical protein OXH11_18005 [Candidatus Aminicenantes bacterium]|nr:hypothetical protein [Candidatus Aminicenantes bacterium]
MSRRLLAAAAAAGVFLISSCATAEKPEAGSGEKYRFILSNDGGSVAGPVLEAPIGVEGLVKLAIEPLRDTQINTLFWQLGTDPYMGTPSHRLSDWYSHPTDVGSIWGVENPSFHSAGLWRIRENAKRLMEAGTDPVAVVVEHGRRAGLEVFVCMRVNDIHDSRLEGGVEDPLMSPVKRRHPDWLLGEEGARRTAYNFALPQVREYKLALAREAIGNYDLDGLDWDFCRHPFLFPQGREAEGAPLLTGLLGDIRRALDEKGERVGRRLSLSVRVPGSLDEALAQGMDVRSWLSQGLLDILIVGHQPGNKHRLPVEEYVEAARGTRTQVVAQGLGLFQQPRPLSAKLIWNEKDYYTAEMCRAVAAAHYRAGAQGIFVFNNHYLQVVRDRQYDRLPWKELGDPQAIGRKDKHYLADQKTWGAGRLPLDLAKAGDAVEVSLDVADDLETAAREGVLKSAAVRLLVDQLTPLDRLEVTLNGQPIGDPHTRHVFFTETWLEFAAGPPQLKQGWNRIGAAVRARNPQVTSPLALKSVEILVDYED